MRLARPGVADQKSGSPASMNAPAAKVASMAGLMFGFAGAVELTETFHPGETGLDDTAADYRNSPLSITEIPQLSRRELVGLM